MEKKIVVGLALLAFILFFGFVFSLEGAGTAKPAKEYFYEVAEQNDFKIFTSPNNLIAVLKKFKYLGSGALLAYSTFENRFYVLWESNGEREFEVYAYITQPIIEKNNKLKFKQSLISAEYPFVLLDCYDGIGTDYVVPELVWIANMPLLIDDITDTCLAVGGGKDYDYQTDIRYTEFSEIMGELQTTLAVGYPFESTSPTPTTGKKGNVYYQFPATDVQTLVSKQIKADYASIASAMTIGGGVTITYEKVKDSSGTLQDTIKFANITANVPYEIIFSFPGFLPIKQVWTFPEEDISNE